MRHLNGYRKLGRKSDHRRSLLRNLATSLVLHERIDTTLPKAKELRSVVEKLVTMGKIGDMSARRRAASYFFDDDAVTKVFSDLADRFKERSGGYTRILRRGFRLGDRAEMATIEFVDFSGKGEKKASTDVPAKSKSVAKKSAEKKAKASKEA